MSEPCLVWFRLDLRIDDQPALQAAFDLKVPVFPVFIEAFDEEGDWPMGEASRVWLHHALSRLQSKLEKIGSRLIIRRGKSLSVLKKLIQETGAKTVFWNRRYELAAMERDKAIKSVLRSEGLTVESFNSALLFEPWEVQRESKYPYKVFTAFWNKCLSLNPPKEPVNAPVCLIAPEKWPDSLQVNDLKLKPSIAWDQGIETFWKFGKEDSFARLEQFEKQAVKDYQTGRDLPGILGTSRLSPYLHFGEVSVRRVWHTIKEFQNHCSNQEAFVSAETYLKELGWREFAHHLLFFFPETVDRPLRPEFSNFPWNQNPKSLCAWQKGMTGYPIVDAGMRELWKTGWMHNRVRMIVASFLVKDLMIPWQEGAKWFWDTLVDADLASNTMGWQWTAGCGADAAPYFRIFNPVSQAQRFDPEGSYVRRWVPEIAGLPNRWIHQPWNAPKDVLKKASVTLGEQYPVPIVDHDLARRQALIAFKQLKK